jgi:hypothetical protein
MIRNCSVPSSGSLDMLGSGSWVVMSARISPMLG